jgi:hypothetical protein
VQAALIASVVFKEQGSLGGPELASVAERRLLCVSALCPAGHRE